MAIIKVANPKTRKNGKIVKYKTKSAKKAIAYSKDEKNKNLIERKIVKEEYYKPTEQLLSYVTNKVKVYKTYHFNCNEGLENKQFEISQELYKSSKGSVRHDNIPYHHYIHSFSPGEVTKEQAHEIGQKLIKEAFGPHAQVIMSTHIDTDHIHNHIILNSVSLKGNKFHDQKNTLRKIREVNDRICKLYGLDIVNGDKNRNISYREHMERKEGTSWKENMRMDIDKAILLSSNFDEFKNLLMKQGYQFKEPRKYLTMRKRGYEKFVRSKTLGDDYTEERIRERIANENKLYIADYDNKGKPTPIPIFIKRKRKEYEIINAVMALKYLNALEIAFRVLINRMFNKRRKWDVRNPYVVMNDYAIRKILKALREEEGKIKAKEKFMENKKDRDDRNISR